MTKENYDYVIVRVRGNKYQKLVTIPKSSKINVGDYIKIIKVAVGK